MTTADDIRLDGASQVMADAEAAAALLGLELRAVTDAQQAHQLVALLNDVWSVNSHAGVVDLGSVVAMAHSGNYVMQAYLDGVLVGGAVGFFGPPGHSFHSHIMGVLPQIAGKGLGRAIKMHQRAWCLDRGVARMTWTYDPLVARNAHFNIRVLGARPISYHEDFYGQMKDGINSGQLTDRMLISWDLTGAGTPKPARASVGGAVGGALVDGSLDSISLAVIGERPGAYVAPPVEHDGVVLVGLPRDIGAIRRTDSALAAHWRSATRESLVALMRGDWQINDFRSGHYVLARKATT